MRNSKGLIMDDGKIRECDSNFAKMGYWRTLWHFRSYKRCIMDILIYGDEIVEAVKTVLFLIFLIAIFPVSPFIKTFFTVRRAKREVEREQNERNKRND
jgi:hypothetical protein